MMSHLEWNNHLSNLRGVTNGYLAVDLFFILSGLVIAANYGHKIRDARSAMQFLGLRFFRLYPLHLAVLGMFVAVECLKWAAQQWTGVSPEHVPFSGGQSLPVLAANVLLLQGLGVLRQHGWNGPSWSISCEFFAYLLFALLCPLKALRRTWAAAAAAACCAAAYAFLVITRGSLNVVFDLGLLRCFAGFGCGVLLWKYRAALEAWRPAQSGAWQLVVAAGAVLIVAVARGPAVAASIPAFVLLIACLRSDRGPVARFLTTPLAQYLGRISYSIYMVHELVVICVLMMLKRHAAMGWNATLGRETAAVSPWLGDALLLGAGATVLVVATFMYKTVEEPGRALGRRLIGAGRLREQTRPAQRAAVNKQVADFACRELP